MDTHSLSMREGALVVVRTKVAFTQVWNVLGLSQANFKDTAHISGANGLSLVRKSHMVEQAAFSVFNCQEVSRKAGQSFSEGLVVTV